MYKPKTQNQRMKNAVLVGIGVTVMLLAAKSVLGAESLSQDPGLQPDRDDLYRAREVSLDVFGTGSLGKYSIEHLSGSRVRHDVRLGAGAGLNYFFTRNIGIGGEAYSEGLDGAFIDSASANLLLRLPLGRSGFAPYALGGGGYQFDMAEVWFAQFGGGMEYRFTQKVGLFLDARMVLPEETKYFGVARLGMRFAF
jgi:hypothetical protein